MDDRKKALELFAKQLKGGNPLSEEYLPELPDTLTKSSPTKLAESRALKARNLAEDALAHQVLKNTGVPIPSSFSTVTKTEDFLNRLMKEKYPELEPNVTLKDRGMDGVYGYFQPETDKLKQHIAINPKYIDSKNPQRAVATLLHEAGHQYDDNILEYKETPDFDLSPKKLKEGITANRLITDIDPTEAYEIIAKGHHAEIPKLREGSFGLGALKSYLKSGTFKALPIVGPAVGAAMALGSDDASAAVPILNEAESLGPEKGSEDYEIENPQANPELRRQALQRMFQK